MEIGQQEEQNSTLYSVDFEIFGRVQGICRLFLVVFVFYSFS